MTDRVITWSVRFTRLGPLLVAASARGVCLIRFGTMDEDPGRVVSEEFAWAVVRRDEAGVGPWADAVADYVDGRSPHLDVPLDVRGSRFQRRVWAALAAIPRGETRSYAQVAESVECPRGARAVARACAANPTPVAVPCHRVLPAGGQDGGYRYGIWRKRALLDLESATEGGPPRVGRGPVRRRGRAALRSPR